MAALKLVTTFLLSTAVLACSGDMEPQDIDPSESEGGTEGDTDVDPDPEPDPELPPTVLKTIPEDGATAVLPDAVVEIHFSEPMNKASVEAAFSSNSINIPIMSWNENGNVLRVKPAGGFELGGGEGLDPMYWSDAVGYDLAIAAGATDLDGQQLADDLEIEFTAARIVGAILPLVDDVSRTLVATGFVHTSGNPTLFVGDSDFEDAALRTFLTFDTSELPEVTILDSADLRGRQTELNGDPYGDLGTLRVDHVLFNEVSMENWDPTVLANLGVYSDSPDIGLRHFDVTDALGDDLEHRDERGDLSQYRMRFLDVSEDGTGDSAFFDRDDFRISIYFYTE